MIKNKPSVATPTISPKKYLRAKEKEERLLKIIKDYPSGISPITLYKITKIPHNTIKTILRRLENKGVIKSIPSAPGYYVLVENPTHVMNFYTAQNVILQVESNKILIEKEINESENLDDIIKFNLTIGSRSRKATFSISSSYPFNFSSLIGYVHIFQEKVMRLCNFKPTLEEIMLITTEANHDYIGYRLEGISCYTIRNAIADFKLYNKRNCVREEYKIKVPIPFRFIQTLIGQGITTSFYTQKIDQIECRLNETNKLMRKLKGLFDKMVSKFFPLEVNQNE